VSRFIQYSVALIAAGAIAWQAGQAEPSKSDGTAPREQQPPAIRAAPGNQFRGMAVQLHGGADVYEKYHKLVPEIAALGADTILLVVHGWQEHAGSLDLHIDPRKTADAKELGRLCDLATQHGLRIILMPVVLLDSPRNNEWRGKIIPPNHDWDEWFKRYTRFILHFAKIAERHKVNILMVGSELVKTETYTDRWRRVIADVRQEYRGKLGYSANWDHYQTEKIGFWNDLDYVGMTSYYELADGPGPKMEEIDENWRQIRSQIKQFQAQVNRPLIFTEVGWCSQVGAAHEGWNYYANQKPSESGLQEQKMLYESFLRTWGADPDVGGIIWWEWDASPGGPQDFNYTPRGKPAEQILRRWFAGKPGGASADKSNAAAQNGQPAMTEQKP
jgi:hypothetical protein